MEHNYTTYLNNKVEGNPLFLIVLFSIPNFNNIERMFPVNFTLP
jgi:hypothetical protein